MVLQLILPSVILGISTIIATLIAYVYRRRRKMESECDSESGSLNGIKGALGRINTQKTSISVSQSESSSGSCSVRSSVQGYSSANSQKVRISQLETVGNYTKLSGYRDSSKKTALPDGTVGGTLGKMPSVFSKAGMRFSSEFTLISSKEEKEKKKDLKRSDSGLGDLDGGHGDTRIKKPIPNVYPSKCYKIARVNSLAPSIAPSISGSYNGLDSYGSSMKISSHKKRRGKNGSNSNVSENSHHSSQNLNHNHVHAHAHTHSIQQKKETMSGSNSPSTDQTDAHSHVSETMSGVSNSNNSIKSLPEFIPNYESLNVKVETNRASIKLTNFALPPLGTPSQSKHTISRIISSESDYSSGCSSLGSYHK